MDREGELHRIANRAGVGPSFYANTKNFILMEFIDGCNIIGWLNQQSVKADHVRKVVISTLEQCYNLDRAHLDHGELNCLAHHVLIPKSVNPRIIDFETASINRKTSNVTAAAHSLLLNGRISRKVGKIIGFVERETILPLLQVYKRDQSRQSFEKMIHAIR
jgi:putative serine/threonine protein kinase